MRIIPLLTSLPLLVFPLGLAQSSPPATYTLGQSSNSLAVGAREVATLRGHLGSVFSVAFSQGGKTLALDSSDKSAKVIDLLGSDTTKAITVEVK